MNSDGAQCGALRGSYGRDTRDVSAYTGKSSPLHMRDSRAAPVHAAIGAGQIHAHSLQFFLAHRASGHMVDRMALSQVTELWRQDMKGNGPRQSGLLTVFFWTLDAPSWRRPFFVRRGLWRSRVPSTGLRLAKWLRHYKSGASATLLMF